MSYLDFHTKAMQFAEEAEVARIKGKSIAARNSLVYAFQYESKAAYEAAKINEQDIIRYILFNSAANLAMEIGFYPSAGDLAAKGLDNNTPEDIAKELNEIIKTIEKAESDALKLLQAKNEQALVKVKELLDNDIGKYDLRNIIAKMGAQYYRVARMFRAKYWMDMSKYYQLRLNSEVTVLKEQKLSDESIAEKLKFESEYELRHFLRTGRGGSHRKSHGRFRAIPKKRNRNSSHSNKKDKKQ